MPLLDVTEVLLDPDFLDTSLVCTRQTQTTNEYGEAVNAQEAIPFSGVVTSDQGDILDRIAEGSRIKGSILICTKFTLIPGTAGRDADLVTWQGRQYTVSNVNDYTTYGPGFVEAVCDLIPLQG
ncbi:hypothetical protein WJ973_23650 [Achromobacter xylosoxidans]